MMQQTTLLPWRMWLKRWSSAAGVKVTRKSTETAATNSTPAALDSLLAQQSSERQQDYDGLLYSEKYKARSKWMAYFVDASSGDWKVLVPAMLLFMVPLVILALPMSLEYFASQKRMKDPVWLSEHSLQAWPAAYGYSKFAGTCSDVFASQDPPRVIRLGRINQALPLCKEDFAIMYSGISRSPIYVAEKRTPQNSRPTSHGLAKVNAPLVADEKLGTYTLSADRVRSEVALGYAPMRPVNIARRTTPESAAHALKISNLLLVGQSDALNKWLAIERFLDFLSLNSALPVFTLIGPGFNGEAKNYVKLLRPEDAASDRKSEAPPLTYMVPTQFVFTFYIEGVGIGALGFKNDLAPLKTERTQALLAGYADKPIAEAFNLIDITPINATQVAHTLGFDPFPSAPAHMKRQSLDLTKLSLNELLRLSIKAQVENLYQPLERR